MGQNVKFCHRLSKPVCLGFIFQHFFSAHIMKVSGLQHKGKFVPNLSSGCATWTKKNNNNINFDFDLF